MKDERLIARTSNRKPQTSYFVLLTLIGLLLGASGCLTDPQPTPTPVPTPTPTPSVTPLPTATPVPTATPTVTPTVTPLGPVRTPVGGDAAADFNAMLAALAAAPSFRFHSDLVIGPPAAAVTLSGDGEYQAPDRLHVVYQTVASPTELIWIGVNAYHRRSDGTWQVGDLSPDTTPLGTPPNLEALLGLLTYAGEARLVGDEPLPGAPAVPTRHLTFTLTAPALGSGLDWARAGGEVWIDPASRRLLRLRLVFSGTGGSDRNDTTITTDVRDYAAPIQISAPGS